MGKARPLVILGGGGFAREVAWLVEDINRLSGCSWEVVGYWVHQDDVDQRTIGHLPIVGPRELVKYLPELHAVAAIGSPGIRERAVAEAEGFGCRFATLVHPGVMFDHGTVTIGTGSVVCAGSVLTVDISVGEHVQINLDCTIGHDSVVDDFVTISPGCHISGNNHIGRGAFLGTGAVTVERRRIGASSTVGAGAVVVQDVQDGATVMGVPAKGKA